MNAMHRLVFSVILFHLLAFSFAFSGILPIAIFRVPATPTTTTPTALFLSSPTTPQNKRPPSRVQDPDGPTPEMDVLDVEEVDPETIDELQDIRKDADLPRPIPHQPWRRGETAGCEAPIAAEWRREAEDIIEKAVSLVGGQVLDVTWFLTSVLVTIDEQMLPERDLTKSSGPVINIQDPTGPLYHDPTDPNPEEIWADEDEILYERESSDEAERGEAAQLTKNMYAPKDPDDPADEPHIQDPDAAAAADSVPLYMNEETRDDVAIQVTEEAQLRDIESQSPIDIDSIRIDTAALSTIAQAILDALKDREDDLRILSRHELVLSSPGPPDVIETQRQFDAYRDHPVIVETQDPFESNRTLKGRLVDRNAMDLVINNKGRMVTIPLNFVKCVRLPPQLLD